LGKKNSENQGMQMNSPILIVEDHQGVRQSLREWLELSFPRYRLIEATSGEEGVTLAQAMSPAWSSWTSVFPG
jgi:DNA-binding NarL/FixJ family response regulator